ncbi:MAG TPA: RagB/SusD family nutrient uptake outer membrane protein [Pedobacter sp.]
MIQKNRYLLLLLLISMAALSCKKYLNIQPQDKYTEGQVYSSERAIQQALNGLYFNLASNNLYGANLTNTTVELLGQRYNVVAGGANSWDQFQQYAYTNTAVMGAFDNIWTSAYNNITQANKFISGLQTATQNGVISQQHADLLKGEAIGIRAMLHFDMLRLFGPVYSASSTSNAIPYYRQADGLTKPLLPAKMVVDSVLADLSAASTLLAADPVITMGVAANADFYNGYRNQRLNYYGILALQARVNLYAGNPIVANQLAKRALAEGEKWFPWLPIANVNNNSSPDRIFSTEVMFGVYNQDMYTDYTNFFAPELLNLNILTAYPARLTAIFESNQNDLRYPTIWITGISGPTFYKFADLGDKTKPWRYIQPLIRKSELYYILAETEPDAATALGYLNTVRFNRNLTALTGTAVLATEIQKEYQKEFWGEGQLFFYYKRLNKTSIPSGISGTSNISMSAAKYAVPLPLSETTPR